MVGGGRPPPRRSRPGTADRRSRQIPDAGQVLGRLFRILYTSAPYLRYKLNMPRTTPTQTLDRTLAALAHPVRREILDQLVAGTRSVGELAEPFEMSLPAVSSHIRTLEEAGLVAQGREGQLRPCRLDAAPMREVAIWLRRYRVFWEQSLERLDAYGQELAAEITDDRSSDA